MVSITVLMGGDFYQDEVPEPKPGTPRLGIGRGCRIEGAIIDKNARIGEGVVITPNGKPANADGQNYYVRDGVVVVPKSALIRLAFTNTYGFVTCARNVKSIHAMHSPGRALVVNAKI